nr:receptor-interacting serine/threonine-protein kinase 1 isoform X1 [Pogona vitticeps]
MSLVDIQMKSEDLLQKEQLDAGGFGMVSLCYHKNHGLVVLKTVYTGPQRTDCNTSLLEEGKIMQKLNHDRVVRLLGVILEDGNYSLVMEYVRRGNLMSVLKATAIPLSVKGRFILEIIEGMLYLNEQGLVHKDLKPENILVDEDFHIKIADLGVACFKTWRKLTKEETSRQRKIKCNSKSNAGTLFYMAPEHLRDINTTPIEKSDVYSFGIVLWSIFANKEPYENAVNDMHVCFCIINGDRPHKTEIEENCPVEIITLMEQAWKQEPKQRPSFAEINLTYKPFYQEKLEKYVEDDVRKIKEVYPAPSELVKRMESLQVDAVAEPPSSGRTDLPGSLHSSQETSAVDERFFEACPQNEPVESCEHALEPSTTVERKLQEELNYHVFGSRMDRAESHRVPYSAAVQDTERKRRVFTKVPDLPPSEKLYIRPRNSGSVVNPSSASAGPYGYPWKPTHAAATPETAHLSLDPNGFYGAGPANLKTQSAEDLYSSHSATPFNSKQPVPESGVNHHPESPSPYLNPYLKSLSVGPGVAESTSFRKTNFARSPSYGHSTGEPALYTIINSCGIQIGSYNHLKIKDQPDIAPADTQNNSSDYQKLFNSTALVSEMHLNVARENLGKDWKHFARKLGFHDAELDEIDHDYERYGLKEKVYQMIQKWLMREGSKGATVGKLALAFHACHKTDLLNTLVKISQESEMSNN